MSSSVEVGILHQDRPRVHLSFEFEKNEMLLGGEHQEYIPAGQACQSTVERSKNKTRNWGTGNKYGERAHQMLFYYLVSNMYDEKRRSVRYSCSSPKRSSRPHLWPGMTQTSLPRANTVATYPSLILNWSPIIPGYAVSP